MSNIELKLEKAKAELVKVTEAYERALLAQSWKTSDGMSERSVVNASLTELRLQKERLEKRVEYLEGMVNGSICMAVRVEGIR